MRFVQERSTVTYTAERGDTLSAILRRHRLPLSRASVLRLNPDLDEEDLDGPLEPGLRLTLFVQGDLQER